MTPDFILARVDGNGCIITETECGAWTMYVPGFGVQDSSGDYHPADNGAAPVVAELLQTEADEDITEADILRVWATIRG